MDLTFIISTGVLIGCVIGLSWFAGSDAPYIATQMVTIRKVLNLAGVKKGKKFYELGSGDGRVVLEAAKLGADSIGIEQSWLRVFYSRLKAKNLASHLRGVSINFYHGNIFSRTYEDADTVYIYLLPKGVNKLEEKLRKELKKGSIVITQAYHFKSWKPVKKIDLSKKFDKTKDIKGAGNFQLYKV